MLEYAFLNLEFRKAYSKSMVQKAYAFLNLAQDRAREALLTGKGDGTYLLAF